jgi:zinc protease
MLKSTIIALFCVVGITFQSIAQNNEKNMIKDINITYKKHVLKNGLTLLVHEDHKAPIVAVNIWYHVGSKNEKPGKTGFAHLFEHLMFNGSENYNDDYFGPFEKVGATDMNGTTNRDRTNYFENIPTSALDLALWMESDRMGHLKGAIDQGKLDEQRGVVQNEKRQGENQPYGNVFNLIAANTYPKMHPYSWTTIGSMDDLDAASLDDVHEWFENYYGPANAVLVIAGDVNFNDVKEKVEKYFGDIPSGPPVSRQKTWISKMSGSHYMVTQDRVPQARIYKVWNVPELGSGDYDYLELASNILSSGKSSRLYKRLVYDDQIATNVASYVYGGEIGSQFIIQATVKPGVELSQVENAINEELQRFLAEGPNDEELTRVKNQNISQFIRGIERIGGFGGKSDILALNQVFAGNPEHYKVTLNRIADATTDAIHKSAKHWLSDGDFNLEVKPFPKYSANKEGANRSKLPETGAMPKVSFPAMHKKTLSNGLKIILAERHSIPVIQMNMMFDAGYAADQHMLPGTANLAMAMLDEGTKNRNSLEISDELQKLGSRLSTGSNLDMSTVSLNTLKQNLDQSLNIFADVILNPSFPDKDFNRLQQLTLAQIQREKTTPVQMALRVYPRLLYGEGHAYSNPLTGSGTEETVKKISTSDLKKFHDDWFKPNNATLVVVGDIKMDEIAPKIEKLFNNWKKGEVPTKKVDDVAQKSTSEIYILDKPGAQQSIIFAGEIAPPVANPHEIAIKTMNTILGGSFSSRINMNLREDKHWSYGAFSVLYGARGQRPFFIYAPVQTDKTKESMMEINKEFNGIVSNIPVTPEELSKAQKDQTLSLPGKWETMGAVSSSINNIVRYGLPENYYDTFATNVNNLKLNDITGAARQLIHPDQLVWVVVGDKDKIENNIRELGYGNIHYIDADGNVID